MVDMKHSGWRCTQHVPEPARQRYHPRVPIVSIDRSASRIECFKWIIGFGLGPFGITPGIIIRLAVSPSLKVVPRARISVLKIEHTHIHLTLLSCVVTHPARILVPPCLPITPNRSLRLFGALFRDEDVGAFVGEDVFPSAPDTPRLIVWPYKLPLSPRAGGPPWWSSGILWCGTV